MANHVLFSFHAVERARTRLNVNIPSRSHEVNIESTFRLAETFRHQGTNRMQEAWISKDPSKRVVLIVDKADRLVTTVMTDGPYVDTLYRAVRH